MYEGQVEVDGVSGGVVGQTNGDSVTGKLVGVSGRNDNISDQSGVCDLGDDVLVGDSDDKSVLGSVVLVLVLNTKPLTGVVVSFALSSPLEFWLVALEISLVLLNLNEGSLQTALTGHFKSRLTVC